MKAVGRQRRRNRDALPRSNDHNVGDARGGKRPDQPGHKRAAVRIGQKGLRPAHAGGFARSQNERRDHRSIVAAGSYRCNSLVRKKFGHFLTSRAGLPTLAALLTAPVRAEPLRSLWLHISLTSGSWSAWICARLTRIGGHGHANRHNRTPAHRQGFWLHTR